MVCGKERGKRGEREAREKGMIVCGKGKRKIKGEREGRERKIVVSEWSCFGK